MKHILITIAAVLLAGCGKSPDELLLKAVLDGDINTVKLQIESGADVNVTDEHNRDVLWFSILGGYTEIAKILISEGADVDEAGSGWAPLHIATEVGNKEIVEILIKEDAGVHEISALGETPIFCAAEYGRIEIAKLLIEAGADVNDIVPSTGYSPLYYAVRHGKKELAELLIKSGAKVNRHSVGGTPLDCALDNKGPESFFSDEAVRKEIAILLRKNGGKTGEELKAEGK